jgi:inosose dehydratase
VTELAERMAAFGVRMAFHHHMGTVVESTADIDRLMASTGEAAGLLFDTGHCLFGGGEPVVVLARHIARVVHVHCKDVRRDVMERAKREDMTFMGAVLAGVFTVPGDGSIAFAPLLRTLRKAGYAGWLVVELNRTAHGASLTYARLGYPTCARWWRKPGSSSRNVTHDGRTALNELFVCNPTRRFSRPRSG